MDKPRLEHMPVARTAMLIRKPVDDVFAAFIVVADRFPNGPEKPYPDA